MPRVLEKILEMLMCGGGLIVQNSQYVKQKKTSTPKKP